MINVFRRKLYARYAVTKAHLIILNLQQESGNMPNTAVVNH